MWIPDMESLHRFTRTSSEARLLVTAPDFANQEGMGG